MGHLWNVRLPFKELDTVTNVDDHEKVKYGQTVGILTINYQLTRHSLTSVVVPTVCQVPNGLYRLMSGANRIIADFIKNRFFLQFVLFKVKII